MLAILHGQEPVPAPVYPTLASMTDIDETKFRLGEGGHRKGACERLKYFSFSITLIFLFSIFFILCSIHKWPTKVISYYSLKDKKKIMTRSQLLIFLKEPNFKKSFGQKVSLFLFLFFLTFHSFFLSFSLLLPPLSFPFAHY